MDEDVIIEAIRTGDNAAEILKEVLDFAADDECAETDYFLGVKYTCGECIICIAKNIMEELEHGF